MTYDRWVVTFSWKELVQFNYDTPVPIEHLTQIDELNNDFYNELLNALNDAGLRTLTEPNPTRIFLYRLR